jgi:hypothetical protein
VTQKSLPSGTESVGKVGIIKKVSLSAVIGISGRWESSVGKVYHIVQDGNTFAWTVENSNETATGTIKGDELTATWNINGLIGSGEARIVEFGPEGVPLRLKWSNGVVFYRAAEGP